MLLSFKIWVQNRGKEKGIFISIATGRDECSQIKSMLGF